jgi:hypothetical protein
MNCRPDVLLVQDKSGSMSNDENDQACVTSCGLTSKWSQVTTGITYVLQATDTSVNWGLKYFADDNACGASNPPVVPIAPRAGADVAASLSTTTPGGDTPTRDAITNGAAYLQSLTDTNPKFMLLVTDGLPNCAPGCAGMTHPSNMCLENTTAVAAAAVAAVTAAAAQGFHTFVVGIGNVASAQDTLNQLAIAGGEAQTGGTTSYYAAGDSTTLEVALNSIVGKIAGCGGP